MLNKKIKTDLTISIKHICSNFSSKYHQQIFQSSKNVNIQQPIFSFRQLTAQQARFYSNEKTMRNKLPETVQRLVDTAPKTGYHGENINYYLKQGDYDKRQFAYFIANSGRFIVAAGLRLAVLRLLYSWTGSADYLAIARLEVDISKVPKGQTITVAWRGKPIYIKHRTEEETKSLAETDLSTLRDPQADSERTRNDEWTVIFAICTHSGCMPITGAGLPNAFYCPCHGSHYDASGRVVKGPAPLNMEVPKYSMKGNVITFTFDTI